MKSKAGTSSSSNRIVYGGYNQVELNRQYNNRARIPQYREYFLQWEKWSAETRKTLPAELDISYGKSAVEQLDIFPSSAPNSPIQIMIHGGYWYSLDKSHNSFVAEGLWPREVTTVVINYGLAPDYSIDEMVDQSREAAVWVWRNAASFGGDSSRIFCVGQSAGGHLVAMLLATDWSSLGEDLPMDLVKGGTSISGIYDMEPIRLCYLNNVLGMNAAEARRNSPIEQTYAVSVPLIFVSGELESEEYARQTLAMVRVWEALGYPYQCRNFPSFNHFTLVHQLKDPSSDLIEIMAMQMELSL